MKPERWKQVDELLEAALDCPATERAAFLDRVCSGDEELRHELDSLLISDGQAEAFIESPPAKVAADLLTDNQPKPRIGQRIAHYEVLSHIGSGGMGEVYLARDTVLGRKVALKLLPPSLTADPQLRSRFFREAQLASTLDHPNVCTIHEVGQASSFLFIAMQYVEGATLKQIIGSCPLKLDALLSISLQVADALASAHDQGIIHRDIKSNNIIITPRGQVKVLDFGLAKLMYGGDHKAELELTAQLTKTGAVMGTPSYMSPEQARGAGVDHRSDIFSLGVVIYEMARGDVPFKRKSQAETMNAVINEPHAPLIEFNQEIPAELSATIDRALSKDPANRYQTMREMLLDLRHVARGIGLLGASDPQGAVIPYVPLGKRSAKHWMWAMVLVMLALLIGVGLWAFSSRFMPRPARGSASVLDSGIKSLAVLPFKSLTADGADEYLGVGIAETLTTRLASLRLLTVRPSSAVLKYAASEKGTIVAGQELKVDSVLEGSIQRLGERLRVTVRLVSVSDISLLWADHFDENFTDIFKVEDSISKKVAEALALKLSSEDQRRLIKRDTDNAEAYQVYLKGRFFWNKRTEEGFRLGIAQFKQAVEKDPGYALAYAGLADSYTGLTFYNFAAPQETMPKAREAAMNALGIDTTLAEAHASLAHVRVNYDWEFSDAEREFRLAIELNPDYATAHQWYAIHYLTATGQLEEALLEMKRALDLEPTSLVMNTFLGATLYFAGRYDDAIEQCRKTIEMDSNFAVAHWHLGLAYEQKGMLGDAIAEIQKAITLSGRSPLIVAALGHAYAKAGKRNEASRILDELQKLSAVRYVSSYELAAIYVALGEREQAFQGLERSYKERSFHLINLKVRPEFASLRADPRFHDLVRRIGLPQ